jgi:hypothetical protein
MVRPALALYATACIGCQILLGIPTDVPVLADASPDASVDAAEATIPEAAAPIDARPDAPLDGTGAIPILLAEGQLAVFNIAVDAVNVYWTINSLVLGAVMQCPKDCNLRPTPLASSQAVPFGVASDSKNVYWTNYRGSVMTCPAVGCPDAGPTFLATAQYTASGIAVGATGVYWAMQFGGIMECDLGGCGLHPRSISDSPGSYVAVDSTSIYATFTYGNIFTCPLAGCDGGAGLLPSGGSPLGVAVYGGNVYWTEPTSGTVRECSAQKCTLPTDTNTIASGQDTPSGIAVDATGVYWTNNSADAGSVMRCTDCQGKPTPLASGMRNPYGIALDAMAVYWTNQGDGTVMKLFK